MKIGIIVGIAVVIIGIGVVTFSNQNFTPTESQIINPTQTTQSQEKITTANIPSESSQTTPSSISIKSIASGHCSGSAQCLTGTVSKVIDGDTIVVDGQSVRFALASTPELNTALGVAAKQYVQEICPVGSTVKVDEDDGQTQGSYGRIIAVVYCNGINLNEAVLKQGFGNLSFTHCDGSEFSSKSWAQNACNTSQIKSTHSSYSSGYSSSVSSSSSNCDPNYSGACIPINSPDLDCADVPSGIKVVGSDRHRLDRDGDGIACE